MLLGDSLQVVHEQFLVLWQEGEHHSQPIEDQQEAFRQRSLVCTQHTHTHKHIYNGDITLLQQAALNMLRFIR